MSLTDFDYQLMITLIPSGRSDALREEDEAVQYEMHVREVGPQRPVADAPVVARQRLHGCLFDPRAVGGVERERRGWVEE